VAPALAAALLALPLVRRSASRACLHLLASAAREAGLARGAGGRLLMQRLRARARARFTVVWLFPLVVVAAAGLLVELATGSWQVMLQFLAVSPTSRPDLVVAVLAGLALAALAGTVGTDWSWRLIPDRITAAAGLTGLAAAIWTELAGGRSLTDAGIPILGLPGEDAPLPLLALAGALVGGGTIWVADLATARRIGAGPGEALGRADLKLAAALGCWFGPALIVPVVLLAALQGLLHHAIAAALRPTDAGMDLEAVAPTIDVAARMAWFLIMPGEAALPFGVPLAYVGGTGIMMMLIA
jgi:prepilin signal peptidase PulO-like enzyme (type II secretory pathway)